MGAAINDGQDQYFYNSISPHQNAKSIREAKEDGYIWTEI